MEEDEEDGAVDFALFQLFAERRGLHGDDRRALLAKLLEEAAEPPEGGVEAAVQVGEEESWGEGKGRTLAVRLWLPKAALDATAGDLLELRSLPHRQDRACPQLLVRLPRSRLAWRLGLPFSVDLGAEGALAAQLRRRGGTLTILGLREARNEEAEEVDGAEEAKEQERGCGRSARSVLARTRGEAEGGSDGSEDAMGLRQSREGRGEAQASGVQAGAAPRPGQSSQIADVRSSKQAPTPEEPEEQLCRYCFGGSEDGELVSPCSCTGGQKWVHLACLRRWQRMVVVSQPTHPAFWQDDERHHKCNVCLAEFSCAPPSRHELMASFTGPELAALVEEACIIGAHRAFSEELDNRLPQVPLVAREVTNYEHWIRGTYLITAVQEDSAASLTLAISSRMELSAFLCHLCDGRTLVLRSQRFRVVAAGSRRDIPDSELAEVLASLEVPAEITLEAENGPDCGEDHIAAVNLARPLCRPPRPAHAERAVAKAKREYAGGGSAPDVEVAHYHGGPCDANEVACCIVLGGHGKGWTIVEELQAAVALALKQASRRCQGQGEISEGQTVELRAPAPGASPSSSGRRGLALRFLEGSGLWPVRLLTGEVVQMRPEDLKPMEGGKGRVLVFWGNAQWSRAQLLGEIARGHWGLCRAGLGDLLAPPHERWQRLEGRLAFAPVTEMTEDFMLGAAREMASLRAGARQAAAQQLERAEEEEEEPGEVGTLEL